jgi:curved DNA-binding protein CbpA
MIAYDYQETFFRTPKLRLRCPSPAFGKFEKSAMVDYYKILDVKPTASGAEIKSAYRRLARERHPDVNGGSDASARDFALIALAYRTLSDPQERAHYDSQRTRLTREGSILNSDNLYARRIRRVSAQAKWDRAVDLWLEAERREAYARTQAVFTTVTLFLSTFMVAMLKPRFWQSFNGYIGRAIVITLFLVGVWHLILRLRECLERYTYQPALLQATILNLEDPSKTDDKPYTRFTAYAFLVLGYTVSIASGLFVGSHIYYIISDMAFFFDKHIRPDLLFYPPIAVLIIDTMHTVASKIDV